MATAALPFRGQYLAGYPAISSAPRRATTPFREASTGARVGGGIEAFTLRHVAGLGYRVTDPCWQTSVITRDMQIDTLASLRRLSDDELVARTKELAARERSATAQLVVHLAELDSRDVPLRAGYGSLFAYCREVLALSEHEAYNRIEVARASRRFPVVIDLLAAGSVNLTTVRLLAPHLTLDNHRQVLESARGRKRTEVEELVVRLSPRPDVPSSVRRLPVAKASPAPLEGQLVDPVPSVAMPSVAPTAAIAHRSRAEPPASSLADIRPLAPDRYRLQLTIGGETLEKLRLAKDMLRHAIPSGDDAAILDRALTVLLDELARRKFGAADKPRASRGAAPESRHIPAEVRRAVWVRDRGRCAFVGAEGRRCRERAFVELHHVRPYAVGGEPTVGNIQLRCRRHNNYEARVYFGHLAVTRQETELVSERVRAFNGQHRGTIDPRAFTAPPREGEASAPPGWANGRAGPRSSLSGTPGPS
jgi:hypothetical protein